MKYKLLLATLLPLSAYSMEQEQQNMKVEFKKETKFAEIITAKEQAKWFESMATCIEYYRIDRNKKNIPEVTKYSKNIRLRVQESIAKECINKVHPNYQSTLLILACLSREKMIAKFFLNAGADPNLMVKNQKTPLYSVCLHHEYENLSGSNCTSLVKLLIKRGALVNAISGGYQATALHAAVQKPTIDILLQAGADTEIKDNDGLTPLVGWAVEINKHYIENSANLFIERIKGYKESIPSLLKYNANIYEKDPASGKTAYELLKPHIPDLDEIIKTGKQEYNKHIIQQLVPKAQEQLRINWFKFVQQAHQNIQSQSLIISGKQFITHQLIISTRCPALNLLIQN